MSFYQGKKLLPQRFRRILVPVLQSDGLPFADVLGDEEIRNAFDERDVVFAQEKGDI